MIPISAATLLANDLYRLVHRGAPDRHSARTARLLVALVAVSVSPCGGTIAARLLMGETFVTRLLPCWPDALKELNAGIVALVLALATLGVLARRTALLAQGR